MCRCKSQTKIIPQTLRPFYNVNKRHKSGVSHVIFGTSFLMVASPKKFDVSFYRKTKMAAVKTEAAISFERVETTTGYQLLVPYFDQTRRGYDTFDIGQHFPTLTNHRIKNGGHRNRKWKQQLNAMSWRHDSNSYPCIL